MQYYLKYSKKPHTIFNVEHYKIWSKLEDRAEQLVLDGYKVEIEYY